jgi:c-di-GMP-binding flagellar brake protein YcgR
MIFKLLKSSQDIGINQGIRIKHNKGGYFLTHVIENTENFLVLMIPSERGFSFKQGDELDLYLWRENDQGYEFKTVLLGIVKEPVGLLLLKHVSELKTIAQPVCIQKPVEIPLEFFLIPVLNHEKIFEAVEISHFKGIISRLGDREFAFSINASSKMKNISKNLEANALIKGQFKIPSLHKKRILEIDFVARIIKIQPMAADTRTRGSKDKLQIFESQFTNISDRSRNHILHYIYSIQ